MPSVANDDWSLPIPVEVIPWNDNHLTEPDLAAALSTALRRTDIAVILGNAGTGKTAGLKAGAAESGGIAAGRVPVYVDLAETGGTSFDEVLRRGRAAGAAPDAPILWLMDNLDACAEKVAVVCRAAELSGPGQAFVFASRLSEPLLRILDNLQHTRLEISLLRPRMRAKVISEHFPAVEGAYRAFAESRPELTALLQSPLLLSMVMEMLSAGYVPGSAKPGGRAGILADYVAFSVNRVAEDGRITQEERGQWLARGHKAVSRLYWGKLSRGLALADGEPEGDHADLAAGIATLLKAGILVEGEGGRPEVVHRLLEEYFAARRLAEILTEAGSDADSGETAWQVFANADLDEVLAQAIGIAESEKKGSAERIFHLLTVDGLHREDAVRLLARNGDEAAAEIMIAVMKDKANPRALRSTSALALEAVASARAADALVEILHDRSDDAYVRDGAAQALSNRGDKKVVEALKKCVYDRRFLVAWSVIVSLGEIGDRRAARTLIRHLLGWRLHSIYGVGILSAVALKKIGAPEAVPAFAKVAGDPTKTDDQRIRAIQGLGWLGDKRAIPVLEWCLSDRTPPGKFATSLYSVPPSVQEWARWALARMEWNGLGTPPRTPEDWVPREGSVELEVSVPKLITDLSCSSIPDDSIPNRLAELGDPSAIPALKAFLFAEENEGIRATAARAIRTLGAKDVVPGLVDDLWSRDRARRFCAAEALSILGGREAVPGLIRCVRDTDSEVRCAAANALGEIGDPEAIPVLVECLSGEDPLLIWAAVCSLRKMGDRTAVPALIRCMADKFAFLHTAEAVAAADVVGRCGVAFEEVLELCVRSRAGYAECAVLFSRLGRRVRKADYEGMLKSA